MSVDGVVPERRGVTYVHMGVNQPGDKKSSPAIDSPKMRTLNRTRADLSDAAIANHNVGVEERSGTFRRYYSDIFDNGAGIDDRRFRRRWRGSKQCGQRNQALS